MTETRSNAQDAATERTKAFLRMRLVSGLSLRACHVLLAHFKVPQAVLAAQPQDLRRLSLSSDLVDNLLSNRSADAAEAEWEKAIKYGVRLVDLHSPDYPRLLREIFDPPMVLYIRGSRCSGDEPQVAIVGARRATPYGINCAHRLAEDLASRGITIVSGLARGIDTAAHRGAMTEGKTIAVFGTGVDRVYPGENRKLAELVETNGAILSEFPMETPPLPHHFPLRNRILAGMTLGTIVIEAAEHSGSLITARLALEANREVFAVPGPITSRQSFGPHLLIRQGARLVSDWQDVTEELPFEIRQRIDAMTEKENQPAGPELDEGQRTVQNALSLSEPVAIDTLLSKVALAPSDVYTALLQLEIRGVIRQLPGSRYILNS
jgi:DNA processing protein